MSVCVSVSVDGVESMICVCVLEEFLCGDCKFVRAFGKSILMFWYRDIVFVIEFCLLVEGVYSEGFEKVCFM